MDTQKILARIRYIEAELRSLAALVDLHDSSPPPARSETPAPREAAPAVEVATPAAVPAAPPTKKRAAAKRSGKRYKAPSKWSYVDTAAYRLTGDNPFRNGNNYALFDHLKDTFGGKVITRPVLREQIEALRSDGTINSTQPESSLAIGFVQFAGNKGSLEMADAPADADKGSTSPRKARRRRKSS